MVDRGGDRDTVYKFVNTTMFITSFISYAASIELSSTKLLEGAIVPLDGEMPLEWKMSSIYSTLIAMILFLPWPVILKSGGSTFVETELELIIISSLLSIAFNKCLFEVFLKQCRLTKIYLNEIFKKSRAKYALKEEQLFIVYEGESAESVALLKSNYTTLCKLKQKLSLLLLVTCGEFVITTILIFYIILTKRDYNFFTVCLSTTSMAPFSFVLLNCILYNNYILKANAALNINTNLEIKVWLVPIDTRFGIGLLSPAVSYILKNFA